MSIVSICEARIWSGCLTKSTSAKYEFQTLKIYHLRFQNNKKERNRFTSGEATYRCYKIYKISRPVRAGFGLVVSQDPRQQSTKVEKSKV